MDMSSVIVQMEVLFIIMATGFLLAKLKLFTDEIVSSLSKFFTAIIFPCLIMNSIINSSVEISGSEAMMYLLYSLMALVAVIPLAYLTPMLIRPKKEHISLYRFMIICVNVGFVGFPVAQAAYGDLALFYLGIYVVIGNLFVFTVGIAVLTGGRSDMNFKKLLTTPILIITVISFLLFLLGVRLPSPVSDTCSALAGVAIPLGMLIVGATLGKIPIKNVFTEWRLYPFCILKLIAAPLLTWFVMKFFVADKAALGCLVIAAAVPAAALCSMLATQYDKDDILASKTIFLTTLFSMVTMPLMLYSLKLL